MLQPSQKKPVLLVVMDGWGIASDGPGNAISQAKTPTYDYFLKNYPHTMLGASGESVGLPRGEVGNTETGHINLGAGRTVYQDLARINMSIADGSFFYNSALVDAVEHVLENKSSLHFMGLVGAGGVHSNIEHLIALIQLAAKEQVERVYVHVFTDGRDSPPGSAMTYISQLNKVMEKEKTGEIASIMGRYWAMDRDQRWDRTAKAYFALTKGEGIHVKSAEEAIENSYNQNITDEFIEPSVIVNDEQKPKGLISENDAVVFFNFRIDRPRQLSRAFVFESISSQDQLWGFDPYAVKYEKKHDPKIQMPSSVMRRGDRIKNLFFVMMTEYSQPLVESGAHVAFPPEQIEMPLGEVVSKAGLKQLRAAESEKERFVTYYFNGQLEQPFNGEDRLVVPSPSIETYDLKPEMSAFELTDRLLKRMADDDYSLVIVNFANADMVGHTGNIEATIKSVESIDSCLSKLAEYIENSGGVMLITADHGNAEEMISSSTGQTNTEHSASMVPFIVVGKEFVGKKINLKPGILGDVAPTILSLLDLPQPSEMTGRNLLKGVN